MGFNIDKYRAETLASRLEVYKLTQRSLSESQAAKTVLGGHWRRTLTNWKKQGVWPLADHERPSHSVTTQNTVTEQVIDIVTQCEPIKGVTDKEPLSDQDTHSDTPRSVTSLDTETEQVSDKETQCVNPQTQSQSQTVLVDVSTLETMIRKIVSEQVAPPASGENRPRFKRGSDTSYQSVRLSNEMLRRARQSALENVSISGGSLSGLIEYLLWVHLGRPVDLTENPTTDTELFKSD